MVPIRTSHSHCVDNASVDNQQWQDRTLDKRLFGNFWLWVLGYICEIVKTSIWNIFLFQKRIFIVTVDNASVDSRNTRTLEKRLLDNFGNFWYISDIC